MNDKDLSMNLHIKAQPRLFATFWKPKNVFQNFYAEDAKLFDVCHQEYQCKKQALLMDLLQATHFLFQHFGLSYKLWRWLDIPLIRRWNVETKISTPVELAFERSWSPGHWRVYGWWKLASKRTGAVIFWYCFQLKYCKNLTAPWSGQPSGTRKHNLFHNERFSSYN